MLDALLKENEYNFKVQESGMNLALSALNAAVAAMGLMQLDNHSHK